MPLRLWNFSHDQGSAGTTSRLPSVASRARQHIPPDMLTFTVTRLMLKQLCELDEKSFLGKPFLQRLKKARSGKI